MIVVSGSKRSGTSLWMQILRAAGLPVLGEAFPSNWEKTIRDSNPKGFYESRLTAGVYFRTNPSPVTGEYLHPDVSKGLGVKIFVPGLIRTDIAFLDRVIITCRPWQEYTASILKMRARAESAEGLDAERQVDGDIHPAFEWWSDQFLWVKDAIARQYPISAISYRALLSDPEREIARVLDWIGTGDAAAAVGAVDSSLHRNRIDSATVARPDCEPFVLQTFDELYQLIDQGIPIPQSFIVRMNEINATLQGLFAEQNALRRRMMAERILGDDESRQKG